MRNWRSRVIKGLRIALPAILLLIILFSHYSDTLHRWTEKFTEEQRFILEAAAIVLAIVALLYEMDVHHNVEDIIANISTRYLPDWPEHGSDLIDFISRLESDDELDIQVDTIGYLSFATPKRFKLIHQALVVALNGQHKVRIITLDEDTARKANDEQFGKSKVDDFAELDARKIEAYMDAHSGFPLELTQFGRTYNPGYKPDSKDSNDFIELTMFVEDCYYNQLATFPDVKVVATSRPGLVEGPFFWLKRKGSVCKEMIFAYPPRIDKKGYAFKTYDRHFMEVFADQFNRNFENALKLSNQDHLFPKIHDKFCSTVKAASSPSSVRD